MIVVERDEGPEVGLTGARFGGARARRKRAAAPEPEPVVEAAAPALTGARFGRAPRRSGSTVSPPVVIEETEQLPVVPAPVEDVDAVGSSGVVVRPYVLTGGRTRSTLDVATLVSAVPRPTPGPGLAEARAVVALCRRPRAIAEIAAHLRVPLGVARVLVGDLVAAGAVAIHEPRPAGDQALLQRVLTGLHRL